MAPRNRQAQAGLYQGIAADFRRHQMCLNMMDGDQGFSQSGRHAIGKGDTDRNGADQPMFVIHRDKIDIVRRDPRFLQDFQIQAINEGQLLTRRQFRHDTTIFLMHQAFGHDLMRNNFRPARYCNGAIITGGLYAQDDRLRIG